MRRAGMGILVVALALVAGCAGNGAMQRTTLSLAPAANVRTDATETALPVHLTEPAPLAQAAVAMKHKVSSSSKSTASSTSSTSDSPFRVDMTGKIPSLPPMAPLFPTP